MEPWDRQRVAALAPDDASLKAARSLAVPAPWSVTGSSDALVWGRCQGSGRTPYQTTVDLNGPAFRCSCPSRKFPCKHALALLLLWSDGLLGDDGIDPASEAWAASRAERASARPESPSPSGPEAADPAAQARRREERLRLMDRGIEDLALWLADLVRSGVASARDRDFAFWDGAARRLVDAQLPGLAARVREMPALLAREDWTAVTLEELGIWWSMVQAWRRRADLTDDDAAALRVALGWPVPAREVRDADTRTGEWVVLGAHRDERGRLAEQRTWLRSTEDGEMILLLDFAAVRGEGPVEPRPPAVRDDAGGGAVGPGPAQVRGASVVGGGAVRPGGPESGRRRPCVHVVSMLCACLPHPQPP